MRQMIVVFILQLHLDKSSDIYFLSLFSVIISEKSDMKSQKFSDITNEKISNIENEKFSDIKSQKFSDIKSQK